MNKLLIIILCSFSFSIQATIPPLSDMYELNNFLNDAKKNKLNDIQIETKLEQCSKLGNKYCSATLGMYYFRKKDYDKAFNYLIKSDCRFQTNKGKSYWPSSQYLGIMYFKGWGVKKDFENSIKYFKQCVSSGEAECALMMSGVYNELWFKNHDAVTPFAWLNVAAKMGMTEIPGPQNLNVDIKEAIEFMQESLTPEDIKNGNKLTEELCKTIPKCSQA
ncbi:TPA: SEL1-like repeat protein [Legionella pneumophila]|nr:hypothetical protein [Legionella pneumophila]HAU1067744.1 SEL1-like repeat protein [Legionella pneumophila]HAU1224000.1 SEL1-like repeat protein [Legionella pneumophila]HAU1556431.1 SEL1-like repeat protein [Legionella pneumophila]HAU1699121.1 SEL1-like repeat protein [Legionella pneumophila]